MFAYMYYSHLFTNYFFYGGIPGIAHNIRQVVVCVYIHQKVMTILSIINIHKPKRILCK
jgi:hypothetical protein